jgi:hypothetical protein
VFTIENNNNPVRAKDMHRYLQKFAPCRFLFENRGKDTERVGLWCGVGDKDRYVRITNKFLKFGHIHIHKPFYTKEKETGLADAQLKMWYQQMRRYRWIPKAPTDLRFQPQSGVHTGKSKSGNSKDDLALSFIQNIYAMVVYLQDEHYMAQDRSVPYALGDLSDFRHVRKKPRYE